MPSPDYSTFSLRSVIGAFFNGFSAEANRPWSESVLFRLPPTGQKEDVIKLLGASGGLRRQGTRPKVRNPDDYEFRIRNELYTDEMQFDKYDLLYDVTGQVQMRIGEHGARARAHPNFLAVDLLNAASATNNLAETYDGVSFYSTAHPNGEMAEYSNIVEAEAVDPANPTAVELAFAVAKARGRMLGFTDEIGYNLNDDARAFLLLYPLSMSGTAETAVGADFLAPGQRNPLNVIAGRPGRPTSIDPQIAPRLTAQDECHLLRIDAPVTRPLIWQERTPLEIEPLTQGTPDSAKRNLWTFVAKSERNAGYGEPRHAVKIKFVAAA